jgi:hypothetical protein
MRRSTSISIAIAGVVGGVLSAAPAGHAEDRVGASGVNAANATYVSIDVAGAPSTAALDINSAGDIVGRYPATGPAAHGFLRNKAGQFTTIDFPHADFTAAAGINSLGDIVGQYRLPGQDPNERHGFLRTRNGRFITIDPAGSKFTNALGINRWGWIVGRYCAALPCSPDKRHGFLRRGTRFTTIDIPAAAGTSAWGINDLGEIVGGYQDSNNKSHVFLRSGHRLTIIDFPHAVDTAPGGTKGGINARANIVSYYCASEPCNLDNDSEHGFLRRGAAFTTIDFPRGHAAAAFGINDRGDIVGTYNDADGVGHGFLRKSRRRH